MIGKGKGYKIKDFDLAEQNAKKSRNLIASKITRVESDINTLLSSYQSLIRLRDIDETKKTLEAKLKNYEEIKKSMKKALATLSYNSLWLVVVDNVPQFSSKVELKSKAEQAIAPIAIKETNGIFIESVSKIVNNQMVSDYIRGEISGSMTVNAIHIQHYKIASGQFIYLADVGVTSLEPGRSVNASPQKTKETVSLYDLSKTTEIASLLKKIGAEKISMEDILNLRNNLAQQNDATAARQENVLAKNGRLLKDISTDIAELQNAIQNRSATIKSEYKRITKRNCSQGEDQCIKLGLSFVENAITKLQKKKIKIKSNEILTQRTFVRPETDKPTQDIAKMVKGVVGQLESSYGKLAHFMEVTTVENYMMTDYSISEKRDLFRKVETVWVYTNPQDDETYHVLVAVKFAVIENDLSKNVTQVQNVGKNIPMGMAKIEKGIFTMGNAKGLIDQQPAHQVSIDAFEMDKVPVTQSQYEQVIGKNPSKNKNCPSCPVENVTWLEAKTYCEKKGLRLPTEAEWEYAVRAGSSTKFFWGDSPNVDYAWYNNNSGFTSHSVGEKLPNSWGLYDMSGNVWEWCSDRYDSNYYKSSPSANPIGASVGAYNVVRGGSWFKAANYMGSSMRHRANPGNTGRSQEIGFRCAR